MASLESIRYERGKCSIIDQLQLPYITTFIPIHSAEDGWHAIKEMHVRGAPAIAIVAALSLAVEVNGMVTNGTISDIGKEVKLFIQQKLEYLVTSRPTAVNLGDAAQKLKAMLELRTQKESLSGKEVAMAFIEHAEKMLVDDVSDNRQIGERGAKWIVENTVLGQAGNKVAVLTHCNTGSLATAGYGTALGIVRSLHTTGLLSHAYCTETRPYNQGARLTAYELVQEKITATLVTDSMVCALLAKPNNNISAIVVGADRVAANGDTANKIGTYSLAVLAKYHGVKFVVAAPRTTIDMRTKSGEDIVIEERPKSEVTKIRGPREGGDEKGDLVVETIKVAADGIDVWNPSFDVTPASLIDAIATEIGVETKDNNGEFHLGALFESKN